MLSKYVESIRYKIQKKKFLKELRISRKQGEMTNWLALKFIEMANDYGNRDAYIDYSFVEDAKAHAVMQLSTSWLKFDADKFDNALAYFTTVVGCAFAYYINKEKRELSIKEDLQNMVDDEHHY